MLPNEFLDCIGIYSVFSLLAQKQWEEDPALKQFGCSFRVFSDQGIITQKKPIGISPYRWELTYQLSPLQRYHKAFLDELNQGKALLFEMPSYTDFKQQGKFEELTDCCFFESFLASEPDLQTSLALSKKEKNILKILLVLASIMLRGFSAIKL
jgi:hypothetical protein